MAAIDIIRVRDSSLADNASVNDFIAIADAMTSLTAFGTAAIGSLGTKRDYAIALRAMHLMTKDSTPEKDGIVQSESEGGLSRSYSISPVLARKFPDLMSTVWGRELAELIESSVVAVLTRRMG